MCLCKFYTIDASMVNKNVLIQQICLRKNKKKYTPSENFCEYCISLLIILNDWFIIISMTFRSLSLYFTNISEVFIFCMLQCPFKNAFRPGVGEK